MSRPAQPEPTARGTIKLRVATAAAAFSCLGALAIATASEASASPVDGRVSYAKRVNLRKQNHKRQTRADAKPVTSTTTPAPVPTPAPSPVPTQAQPSAPAAPTRPTTSPTTPPSTPTAPSVPTSPSPTPTPAPTPTPTTSSLFTGLEIKDFALLQQAPNAITEVSDPLGSGEKVLKMTVSDKDVAPITPTENPRAQALSPDMIDSGEEFWLQTKFMLPADFPASVPGWMALVSIYGAPFNGSSPWQIGIEGGNLAWMRNGTYRYDVPWQMPLVRGRWVSVLLHERFGADGWVEMWIDGNPVKFFAGGSNPNKVTPTEHLAMRTMDSSNNGGANAAKIMNYRKVGMFPSATVYFGALRLGTTRASVGG